MTDRNQDASVARGVNTFRRSRTIASGRARACNQRREDTSPDDPLFREFEALLADLRVLSGADPAGALRLTGAELEHLREGVEASRRLRSAGLPGERLMNADQDLLRLCGDMRRRAKSALVRSVELLEVHASVAARNVPHEALDGGAPPHDLIPALTPAVLLENADPEEAPGTIVKTGIGKAAFGRVSGAFLHVTRSSCNEAAPSRSALIPEGGALRLGPGESVLIYHAGSKLGASRSVRPDEGFPAETLVEARTGGVVLYGPMFVSASGLRSGTLSGFFADLDQARTEMNLSSLHLRVIRLNYENFLPLCGGALAASAVGLFGHLIAPGLSGAGAIIAFPLMIFGLAGTSILPERIGRMMCRKTVAGARAARSPIMRFLARGRPSEKDLAITAACNDAEGGEQTSMNVAPMRLAEADACGEFLKIAQRDPLPSWRSHDLHDPACDHPPGRIVTAARSARALSSG